jgi:ATP-dependent Clp protease ATP-binding subunit ClpA
MGRLREAFRPEFLNRIDEIIAFCQLNEPQT